MFFSYEWLMDLNGHIYQDPLYIFFFPIPLSKTWHTAELGIAESSNHTVFLQQSHISFPGL